MLATDLLVSLLEAITYFVLMPAPELLTHNLLLFLYHVNVPAKWIAIVLNAYH